MTSGWLPRLWCLHVDVNAHGAVTIAAAGRDVDRGLQSVSEVVTSLDDVAHAFVRLALRAHDAHWPDLVADPVDEAARAEYERERGGE